MNPRTVALVTDCCWYALIVVWLIGAFTAKPQVRTQPLFPRLVHSLALVTSFLLLFASSVHLRYLDGFFLPRSDGVPTVGMLLTIAGIAFAVWARFFLGTNWSPAPAVKEGHQLVRNGPYAIVRHPIYSGLLLAILGTTLVIDKWRCLVGLAILAIAWHLKSRTEERYMEEQFGTEYISYRREVKGLIPFVL